MHTNAAATSYDNAFYISVLLTVIYRHDIIKTCSEWVKKIIQYWKRKKRNGGLRENWNNESQKYDN